jgi:hypothetical protein
MTRRRLASAAILLGLVTQSGCASWCARNYPCAAPAGYAPAGCCCPAPVAAAPTCTPTTGYAPTWQQPAAAPCTCR